MRVGESERSDDVEGAGPAEEEPVAAVEAVMAVVAQEGPED